MSVSPITICCGGLFLPRIPRRPSKFFKLAEVSSGTVGVIAVSVRRVAG